MDAAIHSRIIAPLQLAIVRPFLGRTIFYLRLRPGQHEQDNIPWTLATLFQHDPVRFGCPTCPTRAHPTFQAREMLTPFNDYNADDCGHRLILTWNRSEGQGD